MSALQDLASAVAFRVFAFASQSPLGTFRLGIDSSSAGSTLPANLILTGSVSTAAVVPEPATLVAGLLGVLACGGAAWRRRRATA